MKLICKKYTWDISTDTNDVNFYSSEIPTLTETLDLYDYLIRDTMSPVGYNPESVDANNTLYMNTTTLNFNCKNELYSQGRGTILQDFFEIYKSNSYIKFKLDFYDDNEVLLYSGIIYKDGAEYSNRSDDILSISVLGYEKEFRDYYQNQLLESSDNFRRATLPVEIELNGFKPFWIGTVLKANFPNVKFSWERDLTNFIGDYYMAEKPYTYAPLDVFEDLNNFLHIKTGYACYVLDGINKYDWFDSLLSSKGWVWYFWLGELYIEQRASSEIETVLEIDFDEVGIDHSVSNEIQPFAVDTVIIDNGRYFDNGRSNISTLNGLSVFSASTLLSYNLSGSNKIIYSSKEYENKERPFQYIIYNESGDNYLTNYNNIKFYRDATADNNLTTRFQRVELNATSPFTITETYASYANINSVKVSPVINSQDNSGGVDKQNPRADPNPGGAYYGNGNFFFAANQVNTEGHVYYSGNPGNSLFKYNASTGKYINYEVECRQQQFKDNFKKYLRSNNQIIFEIEVKQLITNPNQNVKINNYPYANIQGKIFSIQELYFDYIKKTSKLTLLMLN